MSHTEINDIMKEVERLRELDAKRTPGDMHRNISPARKYPTIWVGRNTHIAYVKGGTLPDNEIEANIDFLCAAPAMMTVINTLMERNARLEEDLESMLREEHGNVDVLVRTLANHLGWSMYASRFNGYQLIAAPNKEAAEEVQLGEDVHKLILDYCKQQPPEGEK